jgi:hypothetical protein
VVETLEIGQRWRSNAGNVYRIVGFTEGKVLVMRIYPNRVWETAPYEFMPHHFLTSDMTRIGVEA